MKLGRKIAFATTAVVVAAWGVAPVAHARETATSFDAPVPVCSVNVSGPSVSGNVVSATGIMSCDVRQNMTLTVCLQGVTGQDFACETGSADSRLMSQDVSYEMCAGKPASPVMRAFAIGVTDGGGHGTATSLPRVVSLGCPN